MSKALRTSKKNKKAIWHGHIVYGEYKSGYVRIRFVSNILKRTLFEVTVDNPRVKPKSEGLAIIKGDYGCDFAGEPLVNYIRKREFLTNAGSAFELRSRNSPPVKLPYWVLIVPPYKYKKPSK